LGWHQNKVDKCFRDCCVRGIQMNTACVTQE
jgi:hypothetical protein